VLGRESWLIVTFGGCGDKLKLVVSNALCESLDIRECKAELLLVSLSFFFVLSYLSILACIVFKMLEVT
jgi:hypothetical protein